MQNLSIEGFELSPQQKRLWRWQQEADFQTYQVRAAVSIEGKIEYSLLETAIQKVADRHEILHTRFPKLPGMTIPLQVVEAPGGLKINYCQLEAADLNLTEKSVSIAIAKISASQCILEIAMSAMCGDSISLYNLVREIVEAYTSFEVIQEPLQYADIAAWQNELLLEEAPPKAKEYWRKQNISDWVVGKLPDEKKLDENKKFDPKYIEMALNADLEANLRALALKNAVSVSTVLLAGWQILLWRITGQSRTSVAMSCDGRDYEELQPVLGLLAKYLPLQSYLEENQTFSKIVKDLETTTKDIRQWQECFDWEEMVDRGQTDRKLSFLPFAFDFIERPDKYVADDVSFLIQKQYSCIEPFKVKLSCRDRGDSLTAELHYDASLFDREDLESLGDRYRTLLTSAVKDSEGAIAKLDIIAPKERDRLLFEFNNTKSPPLPYRSVHQWFEARAIETPDNVAVVFEDRQLTYRELNAKANRVARQLTLLGVKPETIVALCVERSLDLAVGILGILKAGGAYLPLEPTLPAEALTWRWQDARAKVFLTQKHLASKVPNQVTVVCLDGEEEESTFDVTPTTPAPENLAYVIYTSGSTGKPKGVAVEHRQLLNYLNGILAKLDLPVGASFATVSTFAADLGNTAIFSAWCTSGCLHIISQERATDPVALARYARRHRIDCLKIVPSHLSALLCSEYADRILPRQRLILGGEAATWDLLERVRELAPKCQIFNHYGPTETTVGVLTHAVNFQSLSSGSKSEKVPLGRPLANTRIYLLDTHLQPVPIGVPGEIYIGGESVARGYLNRPEITADSFIQTPFEQSKLYKTGDLARYRRDGNLEFLGRIDDRIKLHGFRIELGEISAVLSEHPEVREVVVLAPENESGQKRLVAYVVLQHSSTVDSADLSAFLARKLPEYMVPSHFVILNALPLTPNGKVDRQALPAPEVVLPELRGTFVAPRTPREEALAKIWSQILGLEKVGIHDNFFELGGDSISSIQAIARANQIGVRLTPKQIFEFQTIAKLAEVADVAEAIASEGSLVNGSVPLTPIQLSFFERDLPEPHHWNQSLLLELKQEISPDRLERVVRHWLEHHDALRLRFQCRSGDGWQSVHADTVGEVPFTRIDLSNVLEEARKAAIETTSARLQASLNLSDGPLIRVALFDLGSQKNSRLLVVVHHLAIDGVSWRILLSDLQTAWEQLARGEDIHLPPKTTSFKEWAERLQEYARTEAARSTLDYWRSPSRKRAVPLNVDYPGGENTVATARTVSGFLDETETQALIREVSPKYRVQVRDLLLTALMQAFAEWTKERSLLLNLEGHGREDIFPNLDLSRTVGWFTTLFPVLLDLGNASCFSDALKAIEQQLQQIPNRGFDYGVLRYLAQDPAIEEALAAMPPAQVCFNYLGQFDGVLPESSWFSLAPESIGSTRAPLGNRRHLLEINAFVAGGRLQVEWIYSAALHKEATVSNLAEGFLKALREIIARPESSPVKQYTPSDFPNAYSSQQDLDRQTSQNYFRKTLEAENIQDIYELSPLQQGILFHSLYAPDSAVYFVQLCYLLRGELNVVAFERAWQEVVARHPVLRTAFYWENLEKPIQVVYKQVETNIVRHDWRSSDSKERLRDFLERDRQQNFELSQPGLMRLHLISGADNSYYFVWSKHHLILDGWSTALVLKEVVQLYEALCQGMKLVLAPAIPFKDYIGWLQRQDLSKAKEFWQQALEGFTAPTPSIGLNGESQVERYDEQQIKLSETTTTALQSLARQQRLTLNTLVQGAWALLLSRYSGEADVVFGVTTSGRPPDMGGAESMVGLFINTLPLRVKVEAEASLLEWLAQLQMQLLEICQYEYTPLVEVRGWSEVQRGMPLFESILVFENYPVDRALKDRQGNLEIQNITTFDRTNYPLTVSVIPASKLELAIAYDCRRFDAATINRMLGHLERLLEKMASNPQGRLQDLPLLTLAEEHQLIVEWNERRIDLPQDQCIHHLFERVVEQNYNAVAVVYEDKSLTYGQLNRQADRIANYLQKLGVKPEVLVGICVERSLYMVSGVLGILKAGGAYVPLDPAQPPQRLEFVLQDAGCSILLTQKHLVENFSAYPGRIVCLDADWESISREEASNLSSSITPANLAYLIYTSGSTGQSKGVMVQHGSLVNACLAWEDAYQLRSHITSHLQMANFAFDVFSGDWIRALCSGGKLVLCPREFLLQPEQLYQLMLEQKVDCAEFVPVVLRNLIEYLKKSQLKLDFMKLVICGSDSWYGAEYLKFREFLGEGTRLINSYGLTEATIDSSYFECPTTELPAEQLVPIGRPFANTRLYILDQFLQPVPIGVPGELYIGGAGLARGYHNREQLTAAKFIPDPFCGEPGAIAYKTGDLVRYLPDGNVEFLGRTDNQVKIRGFRIELGEIEALLGRHPRVRETVVVVREDDPGDKRLVAYIVPDRDNAQIAPKQLRDFLKDKLPEYAIPSTFVLLAALPLNPNGKIDRRNLPLPPAQSLEFKNSSIAPRNPIEEVLAGIWAKTLRLEQVGIEDNFFDLGGHSLLATQVISRIREAFQIELPLYCLFESPTVAELSISLIAREAKPGQTEKMARIFKKLEQMSAEEVEKALQNRKESKQVKA